MTGSSEPAIELAGISKTYKLRSRRRSSRFLPDLRRREPEPVPDLPEELWALRDVTATVPPGEVVGVIGPNGAGKSTLLKILGRVTLPTEGEAVVRGRVVPLLRLGAAFHREYTGRENVYLNAVMYGLPRAHVERNVDDIFAWAELERFIDTPVKHYSSGMYLRLAFSVAMHMDPQVLLADEVLAVGDASFQERCLERVHQAGDEGMAVLFVSHDMGALRRISSRVLRLESGHLVDDGPTEQVIEGYERAMRERVGPSVRRVTSEKRRVDLVDLRLVSADGVPVEFGLTTEELTFELDFEAIAWALEIVPGLRLEAGGLEVAAVEAPDPVVSETPGLYRATVRIPGNMLAARDFDVSVTLRYRRRGGERVEEFPHAFALVLRDRLEHAAGTAAPARGVIAPTVDWQVERVGDLRAVPDQEMAK